MIYPDTSVFVAIYVGEPESGRLDPWWENSYADLVISGWVDVEFASALALKERRGDLLPDKKAAALALFTRHWSARGSKLPISDASFRRAASMIQSVQGLRPGDALHLAVAEAHSVILATLDQQQAELGAALGVRTLLL
jgi:predicted nucleic acid-binding protein